MNSQRYALISGHGRSGTNWLLDIFDTSPETFCRNEPNEIQGSPCGQLEAIWKVEPVMPDMDQQWDDIAAWMGSHMGERDHRLKYPKFYGYSLARKTGISTVTARPKIRNALKTMFPEFRQGEWEMPWWIGSQTELERSYAVLKINRSSRIAVWLMKNRPQIPVIHIVRHPGGRLNSWLNRFLSTRDAEAIDQRNKARLKQVLEIAPEWKDLIGDIDTMSIVESETWFWRYVTENIHRAGEGAKNYKLIIYEHLALDPLGTAREIFEFCGLPFTSTVEQGIRESLGDSVWGKIQGTPKTVAQAWHGKLEPDDIKTVNHILSGSLMGNWWDKKQD